MSIQFFGTRGRNGTGITLPQGYRDHVRWLPRIGDIFPDFNADTTQGRLRFHDWAEGSWVYFFCHPAAFTPVCTTELAGLGRNHEHFADRGVKVLSLSRDVVEDQMRWLEDIEAVLDTQINFPMVADSDGVIAQACGMVHPKEDRLLTIRKSFVIDPSMRIRMIFEYPVRVGRCVDETLRVIDALQTVDEMNVSTPAGWLPGGTLIVPTEMANEEADLAFGDRWHQLRSYLRVFKP